MIMLGTHGMLLKFSVSSEDFKEALSCQHRNLSYAQKIRKRRLSRGAVVTRQRFPRPRGAERLQWRQGGGR